MPIQVNYTDKILAGVYHSFTITSDEGPPVAEVLVGGNVVPSRVIHLQDPKFKISFLIPKDTAGQELVMKLQAGETVVEETKPIEAE